MTNYAEQILPLCILISHTHTRTLKHGDSLINTVMWNTASAKITAEDVILLTKYQFNARIALIKMSQVIILCTFCIWKAKFLAFNQPASRIDELKTTDIDLLGSKNTATAEWKCTCVWRRGKTALIRRLSSVLLQDIVCRGETRGRAGETEGEKEKKRERGRVEWRGGSTEKKECRARTMTREGKRYFFRSCQRGWHNGA